MEGSNPSPAAARPTDARAGCERWQLDASASRPGSRQARGSHAAARHGSPCSHAAVARSRGGEGELEREAMVWKWMTEKRSQESCLWCGDGRTGSWMWTSWCLGFEGCIIYDGLLGWLFIHGPSIYQAFFGSSVNRA